MLRDLRFAVRSLRRAPVLAAAAVLTLALGTGLATGVFAVAYGVLLRPLPFASQSRVVAIALSRAADPRDVGVTLEEFKGWRSRLRAFESVSGAATGQFTVRGGGEPRSALGGVVTDEFFDTLVVTATQGNAAELRSDATVAVLSATLARQLGGPEAWSSRGITIGGAAFRVAAVLPDAFRFPSDDVEFWVRADSVPAVTFFSSRDQRRFRLVGRLAPGVSMQQAQDVARRVLREVDADATLRPGFRRDAAVRLVRDQVRDAGAPTIVPFVVGAVLVLLIASANVSGLLGGRAIARQREFAIRRALGSSSAEVLRASLAESVAIALAGWAIGIWIGYLFIRGFVTLAAGAVSNLQGVRMDATVVLASLLLAAIVAVLSGGVPALRAVRSDPGTLLKETSDRAGGGGRRARAALVVVQVAMSVVLLVAAGLLTRTVLRIISAERGFASDHVLAERLMLTQTVQFGSTDRAPFVNRLVADAAALPGVLAAGIGSDVPPAPTQITMTIRIVSDDRDETYQLGYAAATPGFLEAIGAQLVGGRLFDARDRIAATPAAVITESAARMMFQARDPVGRDWPAPLPGAQDRKVKPRVVGVVRDIRYGGLDRAPRPILFVPWEKLAPGVAHLVARTSGSPIDMAPALRRVIQSNDPTMPIPAAKTLDDLVAASIADRRLRVQLSVAFAALALMLASIALWGLVAQAVLERRHELAVRLALGVTEAGAVRLILRTGGGLTLIGLVLGAAAAAGATRGLQHLLHGVSALDPASFAAACGIAGAVALLACYIPARRAAAIAPADLLRN